MSTPEENKKVFEKYMHTLLDQTDMSDEEKSDCIEQCPGYITAVVIKFLNKDEITDQEEQAKHIQSAILGFVGGYSSRHLLAWKKHEKVKRGQI